MSEVDLYYSLVRKLYPLFSFDELSKSEKLLALSSFNVGGAVEFIYFFKFKPCTSMINSNNSIHLPVISFKEPPSFTKSFVSLRSLSISCGISISGVSISDVSSKLACMEFSLFSSKWFNS